MPPIREWVDQFDQSGADYDRMFTLWGERWKRLLDALTAAVSGISLKLTEEQKDEFNAHSQAYSAVQVWFMATT